MAAARETEFSDLLRDARARLETLYGSGVSQESMRVEKQREFGRLKFAYEQLRARWGGYAGYDSWFARSLNNAHLASVATYRDCMPGLRRELEQAQSMRDFYGRAGALGKLSVVDRHVAVCRSAAWSIHRGFKVNAAVVVPSTVVSPQQVFLDGAAHRRALDAEFREAVAVADRIE